MSNEPARWSTKSWFNASEVTWLRTRISRHKALKGQRLLMGAFHKETYREFCIAFPERVEEEKKRLAAERERAAAAEAVKPTAQAGTTGMENSGQTADGGASGHDNIQGAGAETGEGDGIMEDGEGAKEAGTNAAAEGAAQDVNEAGGKGEGEVVLKGKSKKKKATGEPSLADRITTWFNNKRGVRGDAVVEPRTRGNMSTLKFHRRRPTKPQVLMGVLGDAYNQQVRADYPAWFKSVPPKEQKTLIGYRNMRAKNDLLHQPPEVLEKVEKVWKNTEGGVGPPVELDDDEDESLGDDERKEALRIATAQYYEDNINQLEPTCHKLLGDMYRQTGLVAMISFVGPRPGLNGNLTSFAIHTPIPGDPRTFQTLYPGYKENFVKPFIEFGRSIFPPEIRKERALTKGGDTRDSTPGSLPPTASSSKAATPVPLGSTPGAAPPKKAVRADDVQSSSDSEEEEVDYEEHDLSEKEDELVNTPATYDAPLSGTPAEKARDARIARNKELLVELGLQKAAAELREAMKRAPGQKPQAKPKTKAKPKGPTPASPRKTRSTAKNTDNDETDEPPASSSAMVVSSNAPTASAPPGPTDATPFPTNAPGDLELAQSSGNTPKAVDEVFVTEEMAPWLKGMVKREDDCWAIWAQTVDHYVELERYANFPNGDGKKGLNPSGRPSQVGWWTARKRCDRLPPLDDVQLYGDTVTKWYLSLQPEWRGNALPLSKDVPSGESWSALRIPGRNGLLSLIAAVGWWWKVAHDNREEQVYMYGVLNDLAWTVDALLKSVGKGKKRLHDPEESDGAQKKHKA